MPLAAYSYPHYPSHSSAGSGVNHLHPAPPVLADGHYSYPLPVYPFVYPPQHANLAPAYSFPYPDARLPSLPHYPTASIPHARYPHYHFCPGATYCSPPPGRLPSYMMAGPEIDFPHAGHVDTCKPSAGPAFPISSCPNHMLPQFSYPQILVPTPSRWESPGAEERSFLKDGDAAEGAEIASRGHVPCHSLVPFLDKTQNAKVNKGFDGAPQWRGLPVLWKGGEPFALVPLSKVEGEQNLFIPKTIPSQLAPEHFRKNSGSCSEWPSLRGSALPIIWGQDSNPAPVKEDGQMWDGTSPVVLMPGIKEAGQQSGRSVPFELIPLQEVRQGLSNLPPCGAKTADNQVGQDSDNRPENALATLPSGEENRSRESEKENSSMGNKESPIKVVPVIQLPCDISSVHDKEVPVNFVPAVQLPSDNTPLQRRMDLLDGSMCDGAGAKANVAGREAEDAGKTQVKTSSMVDGNKEADKSPLGDQFRSKQQAMQLEGKELSEAVPSTQKTSKLNSKGKCKDQQAQKKGFPAIRLVPASDKHGSKNASKNAISQMKHSGRETQGFQSIQSGNAVPLKASHQDASLHDAGSDQNGLEGNPSSSKVVDENARDNTVFSNEKSQQNTEVKVTPVPVYNQKLADIKVIPVEAGVTKSKDEGEHSPDMKVVHVGSRTAADALHGEKRYQNFCVAESVKPCMKSLSKEVAAVRIQAMCRGYCVRRSQPLVQLKIIKEVMADMHNWQKRLDSSIDAPVEPREQICLSECIMALLLKLDTVQGHLPFVREQRKSVAKELSSMLEVVDGIGQRKLSPSVTQEMFPSELGVDGEPSSCVEIMKGQGITDDDTEGSSTTPHVGEMKGEVLALPLPSEALPTSSDDSSHIKRASSGSPIAVADIGSMDQEWKGDYEKMVASNPAENVIQQAVSSDCRRKQVEQERQSDDSSGVEEMREDEQLKGVDTVQMQEGTKTGCESSLTSDVKSGSVTACSLLDSGNEYDEAQIGTTERGLPASEVRAKEGMKEDGELEMSMLGACFESIDEMYTKRQDSTTRKKTDMTDIIMEQDVREGSKLPPGPTEIKVNQMIEKCLEPERVHASMGLLQQQLDCEIRREQPHEEMEVAALLPRVAETASVDLSNEASSQEQLPIPRVSATVVTAKDASKIGSVDGDGSESPELLIGDDSKLEPLPSDTSGAMEMHVIAQGDDNSCENMPDQSQEEKWQDKLYEEGTYEVRVYSEEARGSLINQEKLDDTQQENLSVSLQLEEKPRNLCTTATGGGTEADSGRLLGCEAVIVTEPQGNADVDQATPPESLVMGDIVAKNNASVPSEASSFQNSSALGSQSHVVDRDATVVSASSCPINQESGLISSAVCDPDVQIFMQEGDSGLICSGACDPDVQLLTQEAVAINSGQVAGDTKSQQKTNAAGVAGESSACHVAGDVTVPKTRTSMNEEKGHFSGLPCNGRVQISIEEALAADSGETNGDMGDKQGTIAQLNPSWRVVCTLQNLLLRNVFPSVHLWIVGLDVK